MSVTADQAPRLVLKQVGELATALVLTQVEELATARPRVEERDRRGNFPSEKPAASLFDSRLRQLIPQTCPPPGYRSCSCRRRQ